MKLYFSIEVSTPTQWEELKTLIVKTAKEKRLCWISSEEELLKEQGEKK